MRETDRHALPAGSYVELHDVDASGAAAAPAFLRLQAPAATGTPALVIAGGPFAHAAARAQAGRIAGQRTGEALRIAVFDIEEEAAPPEQAHLDELHASFDAVVVLARGRREQVERCLLRTILTRDGQDQWIACDWHDVIQIARTTHGAPVRFGWGRATGSERAALATRDAIGQAERHGPGLRAARGICIGIHAASRTIGGDEIKEVIHRIRARVWPGATIAMSISADSAMDAGAFEVDLFAFGRFDEAELAQQEAGAADAVPEPAHCPDAAWPQGDDVGDPLYGAARALVLRNRRASISLVQRHLRIGYGRASRLVDSMEGDILCARDAHGNRRMLAPDQTP